MHEKTSHTIQIGGQVECGSRTLTIDAIDGDVVDVTLSIKKGETVEIKDPKKRDNPWISDDPGEGTMIESKHSVTIGHKLRIGSFRQFRITENNGDDFTVITIGP